MKKIPIFSERNKRFFRYNRGTTIILCICIVLDLYLRISSMKPDPFLQVHLPEECETIYADIDSKQIGWNELIEWEVIINRISEEAAEDFERKLEAQTTPSKMTIKVNDEWVQAPPEPRWKKYSPERHFRGSGKFDWDLFTPQNAIYIEEEGGSYNHPSYELAIYCYENHTLYYYYYEE